jgi:hypothetical protein
MTDMVPFAIMSTCFHHVRMKKYEINSSPDTARLEGGKGYPGEFDETIMAVKRSPGRNK